MIIENLSHSNEKFVGNSATLLLSKNKKKIFQSKHKLLPNELQEVQDLICERSRKYIGIDMLVVDLSCMSSIEKCKIGDLVMIIGEVDVHSWAHR